MAMQMIKAAGNGGGIGHWSFGGGTSLMVHIGHRTSHDVDIFIDNAQYIPLLNPVTQEYPLTVVPSGYDTDGSSSLKVVFNGIGEVDFISCHDITDRPSYRREVSGHNVLIETPAEVLAKKIYYRGKRITGRDIFDIVAVIRTLGFEDIAPALRQCRNECSDAIGAIERLSPLIFDDAMAKLMNVREDLADISEVGPKEAIGYLREIIAA